MISHPEKVLFPEDGITKGELASYYEAVAPAMLPHLAGRPVTMERFPAGIGEPGFMQKDVSRGFPAWLERVEVPKKDGTVHYPIVSDLNSLLWITNQNCITPHVWTSRLPNLYHPDVCIFDLDPPDGDNPDGLRLAALNVRVLLTDLGLPAWPKTTGSKGFHIAVPLQAATTFDEVAAFSFAAGRVLVERHPETFTQEFMKAQRAGRILIDTGRNNPGATFAAAYAVRPKAGAPVSAPCTWKEIESGAARPQTFTLRGMAARMDAVGDLWAELGDAGQSLAAPMARLQEMLGRQKWDEALESHRTERKRAMDSGRRARRRPA